MAGSSLNDQTVRGGRSDIIVVDASISYRLPQRYGFVTIGAANLFDQEFRYFERDINNPSIQPDRMVFARMTGAVLRGPRDEEGS
jgi:hypothetical protein